jgi:HAD superfamily hydrolase (TIGR01549 family)
VLIGKPETITPLVNGYASKIRGVLFDYGNTLVHLRDGQTVLQRALADLGHKIDSTTASKGAEAIKEHWHKRFAILPRGHRWTREIRLECEKTGLSAVGFTGDLDVAARIIDDRWASYENQGLYNDVKPALKDLTEMGLRLGVLSQTKMTSHQLKEELKVFLIAEYFPIVLTSEDAGYDKPDPRFFRLGANMTGFKDTELLYIGNRYHEDVVGARNAGITPVLIERKPRHKSRDCISVNGLLSLPSMLRGC